MCQPDAISDSLADTEEAAGRPSLVWLQEGRRGGRAGCGVFDGCLGPVALRFEGRKVYVFRVMLGYDVRVVDSTCEMSYVVLTLMDLLGLLWPLLWFLNDYCRGCDCVRCVLGSYNLELASLADCRGGVAMTLWCIWLDFRVCCCGLGMERRIICCWLQIRLNAAHLAYLWRLLA